MAQTINPETRRVRWGFEATRSTKGLRSSEFVHRLLEYCGGNTRIERVKGVRAILIAGLKNPLIFARLDLPEAEKRDFESTVERIKKNKSAPQLQDPIVTHMRKIILAAHEEWKSAKPTPGRGMESWIKQFRQDPIPDKGGRDDLAQFIDAKIHNLPLRHNGEFHFRQMMEKDPKLWKELVEKFDKRKAAKDKRAAGGKKKIRKLFHTPY